MRIIYTENYEEMSRRAADILAAQVILKPDAVLGLATGSTPIGLYKELIARYQAGVLDFSNIKTVNLDEYFGLSKDNDQSYAYFMDHNLFDHININKENTNVPNGLASDPQAECARYDQVMRDLGGVDVQLLGVGHNGHIGFNEPADAFAKETHLVELTQKTVEANSRFFATIDEVPKTAITMGIKNIMSARKIVMVASGEDKAEIIYQVATGKIEPSVPATILQLHNDVTIVADKAALSKLIANNKELISNQSAL
ncbi:MAG: glucosamine-6-phosphate deaminase [Peptostreptococcaceae bacterium]|nr:glucosamine-6-phosphate deaminase [Peptostreptococcaceae bacterium]